MLLGVIAAISIMNIIVIHLSHARYQSLLSNINILKRFSRALQWIAYIYIYIYMHTQFGIFRSIEK